MNGVKSPIGVEELSSLVEFAKSVNLEEMVLEQGERKISFKRRMALPEPALPAAAPAPARPADKAPQGPKIQYILSPMVGTFLRALKDRPPLMVEGEEVAPGDKAGVVEAMKVPKDVICNYQGRIVRILVENGKPVEYGQKLFEVEVP